MAIILIGMPGAGKSTVGKALASHRSCPFFDTDTLLEKKYFERTGRQCSPKEIFIREGEPFFRSLEAEVVHSLDLTGNSVVALGGGAHLSFKVREKLQGIPLFYLKASSRTLFSRMETRGFPESFKGEKTLEGLGSFIQEREAQLSCLIFREVVVDDLNLEEVVVKLNGEINNG